MIFMNFARIDLHVPYVPFGHTQLQCGNQDANMFTKVIQKIIFQCGDEKF